MTSSNVLFCLKAKDVQFSVVEEKRVINKSIHIDPEHSQRFHSFFKKETSLKLTFLTTKTK